MFVLLILLWFNSYSVTALQVAPSQRLNTTFLYICLLTRTDGYTCKLIRIHRESKRIFTFTYDIPYSCVDHIHECCRYARMFGFLEYRKQLKDANHFDSQSHRCVLFFYHSYLVHRCDAWQLMKSTCEMNKRVCEHDKAVASGFARTDITVQVLKPSFVFIRL